MDHRWRWGRPAMDRRPSPNPWEGVVVVVGVERIVKAAHTVVLHGRWMLRRDGRTRGSIWGRRGSRVPLQPCRRRSPHSLGPCGADAGAVRGSRVPPDGCLWVYSQIRYNHFWLYRRGECASRGVLFAGTGASRDACRRRKAPVSTRPGRPGTSEHVHTNASPTTTAAPTAAAATSVDADRAAPTRMVDGQAFRARSGRDRVARWWGDRCHGAQ